MESRHQHEGPSLVNKPPNVGLRATDVAWAYGLHCCKPAGESNYVLYVHKDMTIAVTNAARLWVGLEAVYADVCQSLTRILKKPTTTPGPGDGGVAAGIGMRKGGRGSFAGLGVAVFEIRSSPEELSLGKCFNIKVVLVRTFQVRTFLDPNFF